MNQNVTKAIEASLMASKEIAIGVFDELTLTRQEVAASTELTLSAVEHLRSDVLAAIAAQQRPESPAPVPTPEPTPAEPSPEVVATAILHIRPVATGLKDGSSWDNAGALADVPRFLTQLPAGGQIRVRADEGQYEALTLTLKDSNGTKDAPVWIRGTNAQGDAMMAEIVGRRADPYKPESAGGNTGHDVFRLMEGCDHTFWSSFRFRNVGNGAFRIGAAIEGLNIEKIHGVNVRRLIENYVSGINTTATIAGFRFADLDVNGYSKSCIRLQYDTHDGLIEDVRLDSEGQDGDKFAVGIHLEGTAHTIVHRRVKACNNVDTLNEYQNGDGFSAEKNTYDITYEDTEAVGNTDGGYDLKCKTVKLIRPKASGNKRNFRFWYGDAEVTDAQGLDPIKRGGIGTQAQVWADRGAVVRMKGMLSDDSEATTVFAVENTEATTTRPTHVFFSGEIQKHSNAKLTSVANSAAVTITP